MESYFELKTITP